MEGDIFLYLFQKHLKGLPRHRIHIRITVYFNLTSDKVFFTLIYDGVGGGVEYAQQHKAKLYNLM